MAFPRIQLYFVLAGAGMIAGSGAAFAGGFTVRAGATPAGSNSSSAASATSQTATAATNGTAQTVQSGVSAQKAQASFARSVAALQKLQSAQAAAASAAAGSNNLGLDPSHPGTTLIDVSEGLSQNGLWVNGGFTTKAAPAMQIVQLSNGQSGAISLGRGGSVVLPSGTPGNDTISVTGAGSITSTSGSITASSGSITTASGGTLSTSVGGSILVSGSSSTLAVLTATSLTSTLAGTVTLSNGTQATLAAGTSTPIPAGSTIAFTGSTAGAVTIASTGTNGPSTVKLSGAGTLSLASAATAGTGGSITTNSGTVSFTSGVSTSLPAGATISLNGPGTIDVASGTGGAVPVIVPSATNFTTTSALLSTTGYVVPDSWKNVSALSQSTDPNSAKVTDTVTQSAQQALLYWDSFNIGRNTTLSFDQSKGGASVSQWVAINMITDPSLRPSQILGAIQAPGQVYVLNQNGIIFGGASQVNVGALTAASLALNPAYLNNGLLNDAGNGYQFQFSDLFTTTTAMVGPRGHKVLTTTVAPLWGAVPVLTDPTATQTVASVASGDITVQAGAQLSSPTNAENQGGRIALIAPNVTNHGTISTPDGQTILAAGLQVGLAAHNSNDASLRGLDVYVGAVQADEGTLPTGTFTFIGLPIGNKVAFGGSGTVGTYTAPDGSTGTITGGASTTIPSGSTVSLDSGAPTYAAAQGGVVTNAGNTTDAAGNITIPGGDIEAARADVTLAGATVNQLGIINSSTSVTLNGRVDLLADYDSASETVNGVTGFFPFSTGTVTLGGDSLTQILPELSSTETTIGTRLAVASLVNVQGAEIDMDSGALLLAPSADKTASASAPALDLAGETLGSGVTFNAGEWFQVGTDFGQQTTVFSNTTGTIDIGSGATIDVSGSEDVAASVAENIVAVQLRGPELANSPLQRGGALRGATVYVDLRQSGVNNGQAWIGTPIGDVSGYINDVQRTVGELTTDGGTVALNAGVGVTTGAGAAVNVAGGWINYSAATVQTTKIYSGGKIIDISQATPASAYQGLSTGFTSTSAKWGVSQTFINSLLTGSQTEAGYVQGGNGGRIAITAPAMALGGNFYGNTVTGSYQRTSQASLNSTYAGASFLPTTLKALGLPENSELDLSFTQAKVGLSNSGYGATSPDILFETNAFIAANTPGTNQIFLSQDVVNTDGFGTITIDTSSSGSIVIPANVALTTPLGGDLTFTAANIDVEGSISTPGGSMTLAVDDISPATTSIGSTPVADDTRGKFTLGADASLSSAGIVVDDRPTVATPDTLPFLIDGGSVSIAALDVDLKVGSRIDVSGGAKIDSSSKITFGNAGSISILAAQDPAVASLVKGGQLNLGATLTGYSGKVGGAGTLTVQASLVQIGGATLLNGDNSTSAFVAGGAGVTGNGTTLWLNSANGPAGDFFSQGGFGTFNIEGLGQLQTDSTGAFVFNSQGDPVVNPAVLIAANTIVHPVVQSYVGTLTASGIALTPVTAAQAGAQLPSQRTAASLTFNAEGVFSGLASDGPPLPGGGIYQNPSGIGGLLVRGDLVMQDGSQIITDPQTTSSRGVSLQAGRGTIAVLGSVIAPGGTINVKGGNTSGNTSNRLLFYESQTTQPFATVDLGPSSLLSTAGATEQTVNSLGFRTGTVLAGGNIVLGGNIVAESGATLDVSGATDLLEESPATLGRASMSFATNPYTLTRVDSSGGTISLNASQLLYSDATLLGGAGGPSAQGGSLSVTSGFAATGDPSIAPPLTQDVSLIVSQQGFNSGFSLPSSLGTGTAVLGQIVPGSETALGATVNSALGGQVVDSYFAANTNLFSNSVLDSTAANNGGKAGGFASLNLGGTIDFAGPVRITTSRSLSVAKSSGNTASGQTGGVIYADSPVVLTSPYVALNSDVTSFTPDAFLSTDYPAATSGTGSLTVNASTLADVGNLSLQNIGTVSFNSASGAAGDIRGIGTLQVAGQANLNAGQIYPPTGATFTVEGTDVSITTPAGQALPALPLSAGGTLNIVATTIEQGGVLRAPFGIINLGTSATQSITLSNGSITSVSAVDPTTGKGITVPYGIVSDSGVWYDPHGNDISLNGPVAKAVNVVGGNVMIQTGSTIDLTGGGQLFGYSFTAGTGGNQDILASTGSTFSSTSFAIVPNYSLAYAPDGAYAKSTGGLGNLVTDGVADAGYFNANLAVGEQIYLNGSNGLAAGTYTLLPARYALLPGAFLISAAGSAPGATVAQSDGSSLVSGYVASGLNPTTSPVFSGYQVYSEAQVLDRAPYTVDLASTYFPESATNHGVVTPRLPGDSGQLVLNASQTMSIQGTLLSQAAQGGLGGEVDIASPEDIYVVGPNAAAAPDGALVLDSSQLTGFGAASLLIGGYRTSTTTGTDVTVTTGKLVVDNSGSTATVNGVTVSGLAAPDIILVSNTELDVADNATIAQLGQLPGKAESLTLQGAGTLLRVSSDSTAQTVRQNVAAGDTTSVLNIGQGVKILNADGTAAGALVLDSTALISISASTDAPPVLMGKSLTLDSALINLELGSPTTAPTAGLVITQPQLDSLLSSTQSLSLLGYSSIAIYGSGQIGTVTTSATGTKTYQEANLALHANDIYYADTVNSAGVTINAQTVSLDNLAGGTQLPTLDGLGTSTLTINAQTITLGANAMRMDQFSSVALNADSAVLLKGVGAKSAGSDAAATPSSLTVGGDLSITTPLITSATSPDQTVSDSTTTGIDVAISASGALVIAAPTGTATTSATAGPLGASLSLTGASVAQNSGSIILHSGSVALEATGAAGDVLVDGTVNVTGIDPIFYNLTKFTDGGNVSLGSLGGNVAIGSTGLVDVSAASGMGTIDSGAGNGGKVSVIAAGAYTPGTIKGAGGTVTQGTTTIAQGNGGTFALDAGSFNPTGAGDVMLSPIETGLSGFATQSIRDRKDSSVTVDGTVKATNFNLSTDAGSIVVAGTIDASNTAAGGTGGTIGLEAGANVVTQAGSSLTVAAAQVNNAGQGGSVTIAAGSYEGTATNSSAQISLSGTIKLGVGGGSGGTLHLRAPQVSGGSNIAANSGGSPTDVAIAPIDLTQITGASSIIVEGFYVQDALASTAQIDGLEGNATANAMTFMLSADNIQQRIFNSTAANIHIRPGEEIDNSQGDLELASNWDFSTLRYGANSEPGILTVRAAGNINLDFHASLTDGFDTSLFGVSYQDPLMAIGSQSWSYQLTAGADFGAANAAKVQTSAQLLAAGLGGSVQVGYQNNSFPTQINQFSTNDPGAFFQAIRTGTGDITINAGRDVLLLNNLATIYTAGSQVDGTLGGTFVTPAGDTRVDSPIPATYSTGGGNVSIMAQGNIAHEAYSADGSTLVADSSAELPTNWLDREGSVTAGNTVPTTWWIDFTNYFEGVGALGGGNVTLAAGGSVVNVDAAVPTNARQVGSTVTQLGGGDLSVTAGQAIDGGVYYVERGNGSLLAGGDILTNSTRAAVTLGQPISSTDWLPTTLFLGKGNFTVAAGGNLLLGPVANPFLLPQSYNNIASINDPNTEISYFSTYGAADQVNATSLGGTLTIRDFTDGNGEGSLYAWYTNVLDGNAANPSPGGQISDAEPWLLLAEATTPQNVVSYFESSHLSTGAASNSWEGVTALMPPTLRATAFSGDIDIVGSFTLAPSAIGTLDLVASGSINAFEVNLVTQIGFAQPNYGSGFINLSDANPNSLPSVTSPFSSGSSLGNLDQNFSATGVTEGLTLQAKQQLHSDTNGLSLHSSDPTSAYVYALAGSISGLTLFSAKQTEVVAGQDITDIGLYLQNNNASDLSIVSAGRDIIAYDALSPLRQAAGTNVLGYFPISAPVGTGSGAPNSGDIQIAGPGALEVLAGRDLTLGNDAGENPNHTTTGDGIFTGLTSIGGEVNPALPLAGANLIAAAGLGTGAAAGLDSSSLDFSTFITQFINPSSSFASTYLPDIGSELGLGNATNTQIWNIFSNTADASLTADEVKVQQSLTPSLREKYALDIFYLVLRDAGRNHNDSGNPGFGNYNAANQAIGALFPVSHAFQGNIDISSREIKTASGGDINLLTPGGQVVVGVEDGGGQAVDQGILTVNGGNISIFANGDVSVGTSRIFTLHGGNEVIFSTVGNIDAGASSKTVVSAPPTRVVVDPTSGSVQTDLAGLSTGGGIGVLASVKGAPPGDVDLIAPAGTVNAGDAGIRASGNLNISALKVLNADNISVGGKSSGVPAGASVNIGALSAASSAAGSSVGAAQNAANNKPTGSDSGQDLPSIITVEVLGYGGGDSD